MRFIREMIARKAAGDDDEKDFGIEGLEGLAAKIDPVDQGNDDSDGLIPSENAGFEDELEATSPVVDETDTEVHANSDEPAVDFEPVFDDASDDLDEDAELDALDAAFPDIDPEDDTIERLFPEENKESSENELFADIPVPSDDEPMPQLTAEDIQRAMKNRKKIWHDLPEEGDHSLFDSEEINNAVTRPIRRPSAMRDNKPVSVPLELVNPVEVEEEPAMEAPQAPEAEKVSELAPMMVEEAEAPASEVEAIPEALGVTEEVIETTPEAAVSEISDPVEVVVDEVTDQEETQWPQPAGIEEEVAEATPELAVPASPDIQALMARAALEAAGTPAPQPSNDPAATEEPAKPTRRGRVKTRLLGFQADEPEKNIFETAGAAQSSEPDMFPVGWMVVVSGPGRGASFCLHNGVSLIGRGDDQAIRLDFGDNSISRNNHASVAFDDESNQFFLGHGGKSNIVRLNKKPVLSTEELSDGDEIRLGETTLRFAAFCSSSFGWSEENENGAGNAANG